MANDRYYKFSWDLIGDLEAGRPNLGPYTRLELYRLMQFTFRDVVERRYGIQAVNDLFYEAGHEAAQHFYAHYLTDMTDANDFVRQLQTVMQELGMGIFRMEEMDMENHIFTITIGEDLDCSGLPESDHEVCTYDEGFLTGLLESFFKGHKFTVKEIDCWCTGDRTCRFKARSVPDSEKVVPAALRTE